MVAAYSFNENDGTTLTDVSGNGNDGTIYGNTRLLMNFDDATADDAKRYRPPEDVEAWMKKDPIDRLRKYMENKGIWSEDYEKKVRSEAVAKVEEAVKKAEAIQPASREDVFKYMFAEMPQQLKDEMKETE